MPERREVRVRPFCREEELADIVSAISAEECRAVFLTSDSGLGASTILQKLADAAKEHVPVLTVHGSQSLARIPYGVLAPYLASHSTPAEASRIGVLRQVLAAIDARQSDLSKSARGDDRPLIIVDDAHAVDEGTAELLVSLVMAGIVNVVASHARRHRLPDPFPKLWSSGLAENIVLHPLTRHQGHDFCEAILGGPVFPATSWHFWSTAAGNPLFIELLVSEAVELGRITKRSGTWVGQHVARLHGRDLADAVKTALRGLSPDGSAALNLVALAEPLAHSELARLVPETAIRELLDWPLIEFQQQSSGLLVLANPIYGQVIRDMVPLTRSRVLHERIIGNLEADEGSSESLLRRVLWALEVGVEVRDETLLRAAILASKLYQSTTALDLAQHIHGAEFLLRARMVQARAKYNLGDYCAAFKLMESFQQEANNVQDLIYGALLRASTRSALGMPAESLMEDARELRAEGESLALANPAAAASIRALSQSSALMVELLALSRAGRFSEMTALSELLTAQLGLTEEADKLNRTIALTMDSERLTAQGFPDQGAMRASEAFSIEHTDASEVFFLPESILLRQLTGLLCAGRWTAAMAEMNQYSIEDGPIVFSFGGGASVVRGMVLLRTGSMVDALKVLRAGIESLQLSDPQQLLGFCTAMAAFCAARLGQRELALIFLADYVESAGIFVVLAHERAYVSAARHLVTPGGAGLAELLAQADSARTSGSVLLELHALSLAMELGDETVAARVADAAVGVEGPWAHGIGSYADAVRSQNGANLLQAADVLEHAGLLGFAKLALESSARLLTSSGAAAEAGMARRRLRKITGDRANDMALPPVHDALQRLTRREREVTALAAEGDSDRQIADKLKLSLRTVEGHLYRSYTKLGISSRMELLAALQEARKGFTA